MPWKTLGWSWIIPGPSCTVCGCSMNCLLTIHINALTHLDCLWIVQICISIQIVPGWSWTSRTVLVMVSRFADASTTIAGVNCASAVSSAIGVVFMHPVIAHACRLNILCTSSALVCWPLHQTSKPKSANAWMTVVVTLRTFAGVIPYFPCNLEIFFSISLAFAILFG
jgi:hypothetical protein